MFNKLLSTLAVVLVMTAPAASAEMNIVVLDPVRAILESDEAKVLAEAANKEMEPEIEELRVDAEEFQALQAKLQKDGEVMSESERRRGLKDLEDMQTDLQFGQQKLQKQSLRDLLQPQQRKRLLVFVQKLLKQEKGVKYI